MADAEHGFVRLHELFDKLDRFRVGTQKVWRIAAGNEQGIKLFCIDIRNSLVNMNRSPFFFTFNGFPGF